MRTWLVAFAILIGFAAPAFAQNAQIVGIVKDSTGAVIPGATVTAKNLDTGFARSAVTESDGAYRLVSLPPGRYSLTAELQGFNTETRPDIVLVIDQTATIEFTLRPATVAETVTVTGESPVVDLTRSDVSTAVSTRQIQDLPVASRRWIDLAMLTPGTSQDNIRGFYYRGNVNVGAGTREYSNMVNVDGVNNTWAEMGEPRQNFGMDAIQEFKVSTSTYKAEYGLATGGVLNVVTKSGTNDLHASAFLFFRDKSLTAKEYFQTSRPDYRRYQDGGTIGGPIVKDKLCEGTRWHTRKNPANPAVDPYFPINQAALSLAPEQEKVRVILRTMTPNLQRYQARIEGDAWTPTEAGFLWSIHPGLNLTRTENTNLGKLGLAVAIHQHQGGQAAHTKPARRLSPDLAHHVQPDHLRLTVQISL